MNLSILLTKKTPYTNEEENFLMENFKKNHNLIYQRSENNHLNEMYKYNITFILKLFKFYYENTTKMTYALEILTNKYVKYLSNLDTDINLNQFLFFVNCIKATNTTEFNIIIMVVDFLKKNYMRLCVKYSFFINHKINPKILELNKILSFVYNKIYKSYNNYYDIKLRCTHYVSNEDNPYNYLNDFYHFSLFKFEKQIKTTEQFISCCKAINFHSLYFVKRITSNFNIKYTLLSKIIPSNLIKNNKRTVNKQTTKHMNNNEKMDKEKNDKKNTGLIKEMVNVLIPHIKDFSSLYYFISLNIEVPLINFGLHETNKNVLISMCNNNFFPYDFNIKDVEELIIRNEIMSFVDNIETLKLFHKKNINVQLCNNILKKNSLSFELVEYLIKQMNFKPTMQFLEYFIDDHKISSLCSFYFNKIEEDYEEAIILNDTGLLKIKKNEKTTNTIKKNTCSFFKLKNNSSKEELLTMFLKYLIDNHLVISEYFVINHDLEQLLNIKMGSTLHINSIYSIISHI